jgi:hypothetical protein
MFSRPSIKPIVRMLLGVLPQEQRRLLLVASLITSLTSLSGPNRSEKHFIRNMDEVLKLSRGGESSYRFPVRMSRVFWGDREIFREEAAILADGATSSVQKEMAASRVVSHVPDWVLSGTGKQIVHDLVKYFMTVKTELQPQTA